MTTATSVVLARFPWLLPIRNSLRVTGPLPSLVLRAEDMWRKRNQCHRSERVLNQGFPLSSLMSTFVFSSQHRDAEYRSLVEGRLFVVRSPFTLWVPLALPHLVCRCSLHLEVVSLFFNCREGCHAVDTSFRIVSLGCRA